MHRRIISIHHQLVIVQEIIPGSSIEVLIDAPDPDIPAAKSFASQVGAQAEEALQRWICHLHLINKAISILGVVVKPRDVAHGAMVCVFVFESLIVTGRRWTEICGGEPRFTLCS